MMNLLGPAALPMMKVLGSVELLAGAAAKSKPKPHAGGGSGWDLRTFLTNASKTLTEWFSLAITIVGLTAVAWAAYQIVTGLMSHGKKQTNWAVCITLLIVGGALSVSTGFSFVQKIAQSGQKTISDLGGQTIFMLQYLKLFLP